MRKFDTSSDVENLPKLFGSSGVRGLVNVDARARSFQKTPSCQELTESAYPWKKDGYSSEHLAPSL